MKLKELNLISFGKFNNKVINLDDGLNIIYGENESGKTTLHNFIEGMFYGFLKPNAQRRNFLEELEKYRPWDKDQYSGILTLEEDNRNYRIERDFNREIVRVYNDETGKDMTDSMDTGEKLKIHLPGLYFFGFNCLVYRNTISIKQLENKVDNQLAKEVKDKLVNISTSMDDEISVKDSISSLKDQFKEIGTEKAYTSDYGKSIRKLEDLKLNRKESLEKKIEYDKTLETYMDLKKDMDKKQSQKEDKQFLLKKANIYNMKKTYEEALQIENGLEKIDESIENLKVYANISKEDYYESLELESEMKVIDGELGNLNTRINNLDIKLKGLNSKSHSESNEGIKFDELFDDYSQYQQLEEEKDSLPKDSQEGSIGVLNLELNNAKDKKQKNKTRFIFSLILTVVFLGLFSVNIYIPLLSILTGALAVQSFLANKNIGKDIDSIEEKVKNINLKQKEIDNKINNIKKQEYDILQKYNCANKLEFNRLYEDMRFDNANRNSILNEIIELNEEKKDSQDAINSKKISKEELTNSLAEILKRNNSHNIEDLKIGLDEKTKYDNLLKDKNNKEELLNRILGDTSLEELEVKLVDYDDEYFDSQFNADIENIKEEISTIENEYSLMSQEQSRLGERIDNLSNHVSALVNIEEDIERAEYEIEDMDQHKDAINIAIEVIEDVSEKIHNQFAPDINKKVSNIIDKITSNKYTNVKIDDNLEVAVENPTTKEIVSLESLSGGTIDQMYFALRFSIINSMSEGNYPLILDDCFIQYDKSRLENILKYLADVSNDKQILIFTCHNREREVLDSLDLKYNFIDIC